MGSDLNKDKSAVLHITLNKRVNYAGETLQGAVHLNCLKPRQYRFLNLIIKGEEEVLWSQQRNSGQPGDIQHTEVCHNKINTYFSELNLADFKMGIQPGQYSFPFSILLPAALPSSLHIDSSNFIKYTLTACLPKYDNDSSDQMFVKNLHIRQPPRGVMNNLTGSTQSQSQCCSCCCSCGSANLSMRANVTHLVYGNTFRVNGRIDANATRANVNNYKVVLYERTRRVAFVRVDNSKQVYNLYEGNKSLQQGQSEEFSADIKIPQQVIGYSALGNILSRYYCLALEAEMCCCYSNPYLEIHTLLINSIEPPMEDDEKVDPPTGWNPRTVEPRMFVNLPPYTYNPERAMQVHNQAGRQVMMHEMGQPGMIPNSTTPHFRSMETDQQLCKY